MESSSTIRIQRRPTPWVDRARKYRVLIDGEEVGRLGNGDGRSFPVAPGPHDVVLKIDWALSDRLTVDVAAGQEVVLWCRPRANPLTVLWYSTFARKRYLVLARSD